MSIQPTEPVEPVTVEDRVADLAGQCVAGGHDFVVATTSLPPDLARANGGDDPAFVICRRCGRNWDVSAQGHPG